MPWVSEKQRKWMFVNKPELAEKWAREAKRAERSQKRKKSFKRRKDDE